VVQLFGTVWVLAKSLPSSHIAPSAHRHDRAVAMLWSVDAVERSDGTLSASQ